MKSLDEEGDFEARDVDNRRDFKVWGCTAATAFFVLHIEISKNEYSLLLGLLMDNGSGQ